MVNFRVRDLDKMAAQLQAAGIAVKIGPRSYPNGRFARLHDAGGKSDRIVEAKGSRHQRLGWLGRKAVQDCF
jgi:hypothetical protein